MASYYAVRFKAAKDEIRIEKASSPVLAFSQAFGMPPIVVKGAPSNAEYKDLGTRVGVIRSDKKRIALLQDPNNWITFE